MSKLCQIIAVEKSAKNKAHQALTEAYHKMQKPALMQGISRSYQSIADDGEKLPPEQTKVQVTADELVKSTSAALVDLLDVTATKEWSNTEARADVTVGDVVVLKDVPVTYLLFLEKKLVDLHTFVSTVPVLDPSETWEYDKNAACFRSATVETVRSKKLPKVLTKAPATDKHPAQVEVFMEDVAVGTWKTQKFSGAMPAQKVADILARIEKLQRAVKFAREDANSREVTQQKVGEKVLNFLFG